MNADHVTWRSVKPDELVDDRLVITVALGALLFWGVGITQLVLVPDPGSFIPSIIAVVTAAVLSVGAFFLWRRPDLVTAQNARILVSVTAVIVAANPISYIAFTHVAYPAIGTLLVIVCIGALVPYPWTAVALIAIINVTAVSFAIVYPQAATTGMVAVQLFKADLAALIIALAWRRTERRLQVANETIRQLAEVDALTGLLNRRGFFAREQALTERADDADEWLLLGFIDVDGLKQVNDVHGHSVGDEALAVVGDTLSGVLTGLDVAARMGGDEFAVVVTVADGASIAPAQTRIESALSDMAQPVTVGWAVREPRSDAVLKELLAEADRAMRERRGSR